MTSESEKQENTYIINPEDATEMARLINQDHLTTRGMCGVFPGGPNLSTMQNILDIACGPGGWALDAAHAYPKTQVVGVDISEQMIHYARAHAKAQGLDNASFQIMNVLKPLDFPDNSFDLVNARLLFAFMPRISWPKLLEECMRITRPGGTIRLCETDEGGTSNSPACEKLDNFLARAIYLNGQGLSSDGRSFGMTVMLKRLLMNAGCVNIQQRPFLIDYSVGTESHSGYYQNLLVVYQLLRPFILKMGVTHAEEFDQLYWQMQVEMLAEDFSAFWLFLSAWGEKP